MQPITWLTSNLKFLLLSPLPVLNVRDRAEAVAVWEEISAKSLLNFGFQNHKKFTKTHRAGCKFCNAALTDMTGNTPHPKRLGKLTLATQVCCLVLALSLSLGLSLSKSLRCLGLDTVWSWSLLGVNLGDSLTTTMPKSHSVADLAV